MQEFQKNTLNETIDNVIKYLEGKGGIHVKLSGLLGTLKGEQSKLSIDKAVNIQDVLDLVDLLPNNSDCEALKLVLQTMIGREASQKEKAQLNFRHGIEYLQKLSPEDLKVIGNIKYIKQVKPDNSNELNTFIVATITAVKNTKKEVENNTIEKHPVQTIELENNPIIKIIYYSLTQAFKHLDPQEREDIIKNVLYPNPH
jgi:hypothetical protein